MEQPEGLDQAIPSGIAGVGPEDHLVAKGVDVLLLLSQVGLQGLSGLCDRIDPAPQCFGIMLGGRRPAICLATVCDGAQSQRFAAAARPDLLRRPNGRCESTMCAYRASQRPLRAQLGCRHHVHQALQTTPRSHRQIERVARDRTSAETEARMDSGTLVPSMPEVDVGTRTTNGGPPYRAPRSPRLVQAAARRPGHGLRRQSSRGSGHGPAGAARVLDLGCSSGVLGWWLKREQGVRRVVGIEVDPAYAKDARERAGRRPLPRPE